MILNELLVMLNNNLYLSLPVILAVSWLMYLLTRSIILRSLRTLFKRTSTKLDDTLIEQGLFKRLAYAVPLVVIYICADLYPAFSSRIQQGVSVLLVMVLILVLNAFINAINAIYRQSKFADQVNIKSYLQITKLILNILGGIVVVAILTGRSPIYLLSGIGALTAVLMLVFKDTILSFVASIQINSNDLFKVGDWLEAPQFGADGDVIDIALHTVKVQNWDKTITIIPTHKLIDSSFKNWRGMSDSGGRRIKRSINIDLSSIRFCDDVMVDKFKRFQIITSYIEDKLSEIQTENIDKQAKLDELVNGRRLTNIGTFRAYIQAYLKDHTAIHDDMTFLVRQLAPNDNGLPIQVYVFTNDTDWIRYEAIQADIFDHLLAIVPEFGLSIFQNPSGSDFQRLNH